MRKILDMCVYGNAALAATWAILLVGALLTRMAFSTLVGLVLLLAVLALSWQRQRWAGATTLSGSAEPSAN